MNQVLTVNKPFFNESSKKSQLLVQCLMPPLGKPF